MPATIDPTARAALIERLSVHDRLRPVPRAEIEWLAEHGSLMSLEPGEFLARTGEPRALHHMNVLLSGRITTYVQREGVQRRIRDSRAGEFAGLLPFSRMTHSTADIVVVEAVELLRIDSALFPALIAECPAVTAACVHSMLDRTHSLTESQLHDEKMFSLGKLAAGLAHELNNPASAALRSVESLALRQHEIEAAADALANAGLSKSQRAELRLARDACFAHEPQHESPMARADREQSIGEWLEARGVDAASAAPLAEACVTIDRLEALAGALPADALAPAIAWIAASLGAKALIAEIRRAIKRVHTLVGAVKGFTQMDRPLVQEATRIAAGVRDAVALMDPKARTRSVTIDVDVPDDLPLVRASTAELNQVWASLIDNALDAAPMSSRVTISARMHGGNVVISVVDEGAGIPDAIRGRIFDPFFTTKPIGNGRGLGLDTARRIVTLSDGQIDVDSTAGRTEFRVSLPIVASGDAPRDMLSV